jgi:hypothetical protein
MLFRPEDRSVILLIDLAALTYEDTMKYLPTLLTNF